MTLRSLWVQLVMMISMWVGSGASLAQTLPDTTCASAVGVGPDDVPHAYAAAPVAPAGQRAASKSYAGHEVFGYDGCIGGRSGELGGGAGGVWLFAREGPSHLGGKGALACYSPLLGLGVTGHHTAHTTIRVLDDTFGGAVGFTVMRDYDAPGPGGDPDCGDDLVEPCPAGAEPLGCNPSDAVVRIPPLPGPCSDLPTSVDGLLALLERVAGVLLNLLGIDSPDCYVPQANAWTATGDFGPTLESFAGADGAIIVFLDIPDGGSFGAATTGRVWTENA